MIYLLYSADYEVFMGKNNLKEADVLVKPTYQLLEKCNELEIPMTFFSDVLCLKRYRELGMNEFPDQVDTQMKDMIKSGHDVQVHIHPHWEKAEIENGQWSYDLDRFLLGNYSSNSGEVLEYTEKLVKSVVQYLTDLLKSY